MSRTVYGTLLNHPQALSALGHAVHEAPYKAPPKAPVLYIKPRNTWTVSGQAIVVPDGVSELEMGATLGLVIGRTACRVAQADALGFVAGYVLLNDVSMPHASLYRPSLRFKARDTFCPIGPFVASTAIGSPDDVVLDVHIDGERVHSASTQGLIRPAAQLLADVTEFMTLAPGDILAVGVAPGAPRARAGQRVVISAAGLGALENTLQPEGSQP